MTPLPVPFVPLPTRLIDELMPALSDTEWRVVCVVARATVGWRISGGHKPRDWLTQSQLKRRTGRASAAVSKAVDRLVRRGLLEVTDLSGLPLRTPAARRRSRSRLYYALSTSEGTGPGLCGQSAYSIGEHRKAKTTDRNSINR